MLDSLSLRVAFAVLAVVMLVLFYLVSYRISRSVYAGWWCVALACFLSGTSAFLLHGTGHQAWANPLGNGLTVAGAAALWAGARSMRTAPAPWWLTWSPAVVMVIVTLVDDPASDPWAGGALFLGLMASMIGLASAELAMYWRTLGDDRSGHGDAYRPMLAAMGAAAGVGSVFYAARLVVYLALGPESEIFRTWFDGQATTLLLVAVLATACFTMASLSSEQRSKELRVLATHDGLTGLLTRSAFLRQAEEQVVRAAAAGLTTTLVLVDIDHFKSVNDSRGHIEGDRVLKRFAEVCTAVLGDAALVGRFGGDEFVILLAGIDLAQAEPKLGEISRQLSKQALGKAHLMPSVSCGMVEVDPRAGLDVSLAGADAALYAAKQDGRDRIVRGDVGTD